MLEGSDRGLLKILSQYLAEETVEKKKKTLIQDGDIRRGLISLCLYKENNKLRD
jgi:hypothetical protein